MRLFYLKSAFCAIEKGFVFGVGTGDVQTTMNECYAQSGSPLDKEWYKRPHNQFVTIFVALGLIGLIVFLVSLIYPLILLWKELSILYWLFIASAIVSFLFEDTLETQVGLSFFAIFNTLFLTNAYFRKKQILPD
jgi:O-antigen ligase